MAARQQEKLLITGGTGFVGRAVVSRLSGNSQYKLTVAVRRPAPDLAAEVCFIRDLGPGTDWQSISSDVKAVIHTAGRVHIMRDTTSDPLLEYRKVNLEGTLRLARHAAAGGVRRFIFISSAKVNGEDMSCGTRYTTDDTPAPADFYAISKLEAELGLREIATETGMEVVIIRPPLVYGPHVKGNFLRLLRWIERGVPLPFRNVDNRRSLVNVRNLVDLIVRCIEHPSAAGETFLVSDGKDISTADLVRYLAAAMGRKPRLFSMPLSLSRSALKVMGKEDLWQRLFGSLQVSCDKAKDLLDWRPPVSVADGLEEVGRWYVESKTDR